MAVFEFLRKRPTLCLMDKDLPEMIWGDGVPNGSISPFKDVPTGSLYLRVDSGSSSAPLYYKAFNNQNEEDWKPILQSDTDGILSNSSSGASAAYIKSS